MAYVEKCTFSMTVVEISNVETPTFNVSWCLLCWSWWQAVWRLAALASWLVNQDCCPIVFSRQRRQGPSHTHVVPSILYPGAPERMTPHSEITTQIVIAWVSKDSYTGLLLAWWLGGSDASLATPRKRPLAQPCSHVVASAPRSKSLSRTLAPPQYVDRATCSPHDELHYKNITSHWSRNVTSISTFLSLFLLSGDVSKDSSTVLSISFNTIKTQTNLS